MDDDDHDGDNGGGKAENRWIKVSCMYPATLWWFVLYTM